MMILIGLLVIAIGAFCQSSSYVPINKIKDWSWESYWLVQGVFAWLLFPLVGALIAVPAGESLWGLFSSNPKASLLTMLFGMLWGVGGLTFGLSMRYLGVALGQSLALGTCAGLGAILGPVFTGHASDLTSAVIIGVVVTLIGIAIIGVAGAMKSKALPEEEKKKSVKDFNFDGKNHTFGDYQQGRLWGNNILFCCLAGLLWYSQFFGLSLGKGFLTNYPTLITFSWCILMALNVVFSNVWGIILKEWKGVSKKTVLVLIIGIVVLIISTFLPQLL